MRNFNFAFFFALYLASNGWVYLNKPRHFLLLSIVLTLPLLFLAVSSLGAKPKPTGDETSSDASSGGADQRSFIHLQESVLPTLSAIVVTAVFLFFVYSKSEAGIFFFLPRLQGWDLYDGLQMLVFGTGMGACGIGIWAAWASSRMKTGGPAPSDFTRRVLLIDSQSGLRLIVYFVILFAAWAAGVGAVIAINRGAQWSSWIIVAGRASVALVLLILSSFMRVPISIGCILAAAGCWGLLIFNLGRIPDSVVFIAAQLAVFALYANITKFISPGGRTRGTQATPAQTEDGN